MSDDAKAIRDAFISPNVWDANGEPANLIDVLEGLPRACQKIAHAISADAAPSNDATGGRVDSLTEAVMGVTAGLVAISRSIDNLALAVQEHGNG